MPTQRIIFRNGSANPQDWQTTVREEFQLLAGRSRAGTLTWPGNDEMIRISVSTEELITAADLKYAQLTGLWSLHSQTPNEWNFSYVGNDVQVTCLLTDRAVKQASKSTLHFEFE